VLHRAPESEIRGKNVKPAVMVAGLFALVFVASQLESVAGISLNVGELNEAAQDTQGTREESGGTLLAFAGAVTNPLQIPIAIVTTLFRPLIFDAYLGPQILGQSIEGTALFTIALLNLRRRAEWVARIRASETLSIAFFYLLFCSIGFAAINNAGTLARQRAQWLPALIVLLCVVKWTKPTPQELRAPIDLGAEEPAGSATKANLRRPASLW